MALTNEKDSSSDDGVMVEVEEEVELSEQLADEGLLTAEKLDAHNKQQTHPTPNDEDDNKNNIEDNSTAVGAGIIFGLPGLLIGGLLPNPIL